MRQNNEEGRAKALSEERDIDGRHLSDADISMCGDALGFKPRGWNDACYIRREPATTRWTWASAR